MTRRFLSISLFAFLLAPAALLSQAAAKPTPTLPSQRILIHVHTADKADWQAALNKADEYMSTAKPGTTLVEVLATGDGLKLIDKNSSMSTEVMSSLNKDVSFRACHASMRAAHMTIDQLQSGVGTVPSGHAEIALRKADNWTVLDGGSLK